jgi:hypothetical protein
MSEEMFFAPLKRAVPPFNAAETREQTSAGNTSTLERYREQGAEQDMNTHGSGI